MADYRHFYIECRSVSGWVVPANFVPTPTAFESHAHLGEFASAHPRWHWLDLFAIGRHVYEPLFPLRSGPPDDRRGSALLRHLDSFDDYETNESHLSWIPYGELFVDCWDAETLVIGRQLPACHALLFGNGQQPFPTAELVAVGVEEKELEQFRIGWWTDQPADMTFGPDRHHLSQLPPDRDVCVTWRETIAGFIGEPYADTFRELRRYGRDEDLRILVMWG